MSNILENLRKILSSRYGRDVRQAIHDSILDCYEDGKAGAIDITAREQIETKMDKTDAVASGSFHMNPLKNVDYGNWSASIGHWNKTTAWYSYAFGDKNECTSQKAIAIGQENKSNNTGAITLGDGLVAYNPSMVVVGKDNDSRASAISPYDVFVVGVGEPNTKKNGLIIRSSNFASQVDVIANGDLYVNGSLFVGGTELVPRSEIEFQDGEEWTIGVGFLPVFAGYVSSGTTTLGVTIPLPKSAKGMSVSLANDNGLCTFRYYGGYVYTPDAVSTYNVALTKMKQIATPNFTISEDGKYMQFWFTANTGTTWRGPSTTTNPLINNTCVTGGFNGVTLKFTKAAAQVEE